MVGYSTNESVILAVSQKKISDADGSEIQNLRDS